MLGGQKTDAAIPSSVPASLSQKALPGYPIPSSTSSNLFNASSAVMINATPLKQPSMGMPGSMGPDGKMTPVVRMSGTPLNQQTPNGAFPMGPPSYQRGASNNWPPSIPGTFGPNPYIDQNLAKANSYSMGGQTPHHVSKQQHHHATPSNPNGMPMLPHTKSGHMPGMAGMAPQAGTPYNNPPRRNPTVSITPYQQSYPPHLGRTPTSTSNAGNAHYPNGTPVGSNPYYKYDLPVAPPPMAHRKPLLPYTNAYAARLKEGTTSLLLPIDPPGKRKRAAATASASAIANVMKGVEVESDSDSDYISDDDEYSSRRRSRRHQERERGRDAAVARQQMQLHMKALAEAEKNAIPPRRAVKRTRHDYLLPYYRDQVANISENLVPIRLDIELEGYKLRDSFMWNMKERFLTPEKFAELLCEDLDVATSVFAPMIVESIKAQIQEHQLVFLSEVPADEDMRITINLDIHFGTYSYRDRFEWDLSSSLSPEEFSRILASDLGLGGEFASLAAHAIHEQLLRGKAVLSAGGDEDEGAAIMMFREATRAVGGGGKGGRAIMRNEREVLEWAPSVEAFDREAAELERAQQDSDRNARKSRRDRYGNGTGNANGNGMPAYQRKRSSYMEQTPEGLAPTAEEGWQASEDRGAWRCAHCLCNGKQTSMPRPGPAGPRSLCNSCGLFLKNKEELPDHRKDLFK